MRDDWELLGLQPGAPLDDVRAAYRRLAKQTHPDKGGSDALFRLLEDAYRRILDGTPSDAPPAAEPSGPDGAAERDMSAAARRPHSEWPQPPPAPDWAADGFVAPRRPERRRFAAFWTAVWVVAVAGRWPSTVRGALVGLGVAVLAGAVAHSVVHVVVLSEIAEYTPVVVMVVRCVGHIGGRRSS
jgi:hypothetical protein